MTPTPLTQTTTTTQMPAKDEAALAMRPIPKSCMSLLLSTSRVSSLPITLSLQFEPTDPDQWQIALETLQFIPNVFNDSETDDSLPCLRLSIVIVSHHSLLSFLSPFAPVINFSRASKRRSSFINASFNTFSIKRHLCPEYESHPTHRYESFQVQSRSNSSFVPRQWKNVPYHW